MESDMNCEKDIGPRFRRIHELIRHIRDRDTQAIQITMAQAHVLGFLHERAGEKTSQKNIEEHLHVTHPTVIGILKRLEEKGYIRIVQDEEDHRVKNVYLTEKEKEVFHDLSESRKKTEERIVKNFTEEEKLLLKSFLNRIIDNLSEEEDSI